MLASVSRTARLGDQLQLDDESNSKIADRYTTGSSARHRVAVGDLPTSSVSEPQLVLEQACSARTHRGIYLFLNYFFKNKKRGQMQMALGNYGFTAYRFTSSLTSLVSTHAHAHAEERV